MNISNNNFVKSLSKSLTGTPGDGYEKETEYVRIATQNNTIRTNHIAKIDNAPQNNKRILCGDKDETFRQISEWSKLM